MNRIVHIAGLFLMAALSLSGCRKRLEAGPPRAVPVRPDGAIALQVMTFNVRYENPGDTGLHEWRNRLPGAVKMIAREKPDIIGVQEALHGQAADLWASLPEYGFHGIGREDGKTKGEYSGIFYRKDRFKPDPNDKGTFWLSDTPDVPNSMTWGNGITRIAAWIRLTDLATGRCFYVFNTHWDHKNQISREKAALMIATRIDSRQHQNEPVVLTGDFNSVESNPGYLYLTGHPGKSGEVTEIHQHWNRAMVDTFATLHPNEANRRTLHFFSGDTKGNAKIDHILVTPGAKIVDAKIVTADQPVVSDHFPVTATFLFPPP